MDGLSKAGIEYFTQTKQHYNGMEMEVSTKARIESFTRFIPQW
jgi:hypothetical protein